MTTAKIWTDGGSRPVNGETHGGWGCYVHTSNDDRYAAYGPSGLNATNNVAELMGYRQACEETLKHGFTDVTFHLDSKYVLDNSQKSLKKWEANGWMTTTGTEVKNKPYWQDISKLQVRMKEANVKCAYKWVKGHSGDPGNEMADTFATRGLYDSAEGMDADKILYEEIKPTALVVQPIEEAIAGKPAKKKKRVKLPDSNAFLCCRRLVDISNRPQAKTVDGRTIYMTTTFPTATKGATEDEGKKKEAKNRNLGLVDPDTIEGLVLANEECPFYANLRAKQQSVSLPSADFPFLVMWDKFITKKNWRSTVELGTEAFIHRRNNVLFHDGVTELTTFLSVPRLAHDAINSMMVKLDLLDSYENGKIAAVDIQDVTDIFMVTDDKGNQTAIKDYKEANAAARAGQIKAGEASKSKPKVKSAVPDDDKLLLINTEFNGKTLPLRLTMGIDFPARAALTRMAKQDGGITIHLIKHVKTPVTFRYSLVIKSANNIGLFNTPYANLRMAP